MGRAMASRYASAMGGSKAVGQLEVDRSSVSGRAADFGAIVRDLVDCECPEKFEEFASALDREWLEECLRSEGDAAIRRRKLPVEQALWLVVGMGLFRDRSIVEVVEHLGLVLPGPGGARRSVAPSAVPQSRRRLGVRSVEAIFNKTATHWALAAADGDRWRGLGIFGADGTTLHVPDSDENRNEFGLHAGKNGTAAYPQVRLVMLMALRSHLVAGASFGACIGKGTGEQSLMDGLWERVPERSLIIVDRGFINFGAFYRYQFSEHLKDRHWLVRAKSNLLCKTIAALGDGDTLVEIALSKEARAADPLLPETMRARAIVYERPNAERQTLLTSLMDAKAYPAKEVIALYHERWELELGYDEIKTHMLERQEALRSRTVNGLQQELWGILTAYNLVRKRMLEVALDLGVVPTRISFRHTLQLVRIFCLVESRTTASGKIPGRLGDLEEMIGLLVLPPRRPGRINERQVKRQPKKYKNKPSGLPRPPN